MKQRWRYRHCKIILLSWALSARRCAPDRGSIGASDSNTCATCRRMPDPGIRKTRWTELRRSVWLTLRVWVRSISEAVRHLL